MTLRNNSGPIRVLIAGEFQQGKSSLLNCLMQREVAATGYGSSTTLIPAFYSYGENESWTIYDGAGRISDQGESIGKYVVKSKDIYKNGHSAAVRLPVQELRYITFIDSPGRNDAHPKDWATDELLENGEVDYVLYLAANKQEGTIDKAFLSKTMKQSLPVAIVMNCGKGGTGNPSPISVENERIAAKYGSYLELEKIITYSPIFRCNILWYWYGCHLAQKPTDDEKRKYIEEHYIGGHFKGSIPSSVEIVTQSGFEVLREFLLPSPWNFLSSVYSRARLHRAALEHQEKIKEIGKN
ncbi:MAG: GTPase [Syntrophales bacterium]